MGQANGKEKGESSNQSVDGGFLIPQGVYSSAQDYDHGVVKSHIQNRKLAPFYTGLDDEEAYAQATFNNECPICFLHYPSPLNQTRCCTQPICTECFVQIKRADPNHTNPPSSEPAACPFCQESNFGVIYRAPPPGVLNGEIRSIAGVAEGADAAREHAEGIAEGSNAQGKKRKSFGHRDPDVITIDAIRPDWQAKLTAAEAATTRRANRRIIMRQVGDRLIPVGVSSSRLGSELPPGSVAGPGGAIIIGENSRWGGGLLSSMGGGGREGRGGRGRRDLTQLLQGLGEGGADMEEIMMMEAMRLSLLEHEEQQRRQAQAQSRQDSEGDAVPNTAPLEQSNQTLSLAASLSVEGTSQAQSAPAGTASSQLQQQQTQPRVSSLGNDAPSSAPHHPPLTPQELGISSSMMAELSELVEGGLPIQSAPTPTPSGSRATPQQFPQAQSAAATAFAPSSPVTSSFTSASTSPTVGSPSRIGSNPNNPFRRMGGASSNNSPSHSRQHSSLQTSWTDNQASPGSRTDP